MKEFHQIVSGPNRWLSGLISVVALFILTRAAAVEAAPVRFALEHVYPYPTGSWLTSATWGPSGFVAVGSGGEILFSEDALVWQKDTNGVPPGAGFLDVCHYNGKYLAVGVEGALLWSTNGQRWHEAGATTNSRLRTCTGGGGQYVIVAGNNTLLISTNAEDWEQRPAPTDFVDIVYGDNQWVAVNWSANIYTSTDLQNWTTTNVGPFGGPVLDRVCFGQGRYIIGGAWDFDQPNALFGTVILSSTNGLAWSFASLNGLDAFGEVRDSVFANGQFTMAQAGSFLRSTNGQNWEKIEGVDARGAWRGLAGSSAGQLLAVGDFGDVATSYDGKTWYLISSNPKEFLHSIAYADGHFVAVGGSPLYIGGRGSAAAFTSTNGYDWQSSLTDLPAQLSSVAHGRRRWVVTGEYGQIFASTNAVDWSNRSIPLSYDLSSVVFGGGRFLAFASGRNFAYQSRDGLRWTSVKVYGDRGFGAVRFLNGQFVSVGENGTLYFSVGGLRWSARSTHASSNLNCVAYGDHQYVAGGDSVILTSRNGIQWHQTSVPLSVQSIEFVNGLFIAMGSPSGVLVSRDAVKWEPLEDRGVRTGVDSFAFGDGILVGISGISLYRGTLHFGIGSCLLSD